MVYPPRPASGTHLRVCRDGIERQDTQRTNRPAKMAFSGQEKCFDLLNEVVGLAEKLVHGFRSDGFRNLVVRNLTEFERAMECLGHFLGKVPFRTNSVSNSLITLACLDGTLPTFLQQRQSGRRTSHSRYGSRRSADCDNHP